MTNVVIASAARTAVGSFSGAFAKVPAHDLGAAVEQHRHVLLRQAEVRCRHRVPQARALPGPVRVDHLVQPGADPPEHGAVLLGVPFHFQI